MATNPLDFKLTTTIMVDLNDIYNFQKDFHIISPNEFSHALTLTSTH
jgi:hypothetical protein